ncbi:MAG: cation diffusion facilitator family transporter [Tepidisphaeraceae bacterium]
MLRHFRHVPRPELAAAATSVVVSVLLLIVKFAAYHLTGSAAIFSDALESIVNVVASCVAAWSLFLAHQPADAQHPYGHGKVEFLSAGFEGGMILVAACVIAWRAIEEMIEGPGVHELRIGLLLIFLAGAVNGAVGLMLLRSGRQRRSPTLVADGQHLLTDAITSAAVLLALLVMWVMPRWTWVDPIAAVLVAIYIAVTGLRLLSQSAAGLMDEQDADDEKLLRQILDAHVADSAATPRICSYHKLRHRHSGRYHWVDFHVVVPATWDVKRGHEVASAIEYEIEQALGEGNATAHVEPCIQPRCASCGGDLAAGASP